MRHLICRAMRESFDQESVWPELATALRRLEGECEVLELQLREALKVLVLDRSYQATGDDAARWKAQ